MKGNNENNSINRRKGVKEWHVVDDVGSAYNDAGSVENLMEDLKHISIDEEETISEQMISESKL